ncbi:DMT family transporter [Cupriavidus basilensis]
MSPEAANQLMNAEPASPISPMAWRTRRRQLAFGMALCALLIWSTLAVSVVSISTLSPLLSTGIGLAGGGLLGLPLVPWRSLVLRHVLAGAAAMFGYHALYFLSLRTADPISANLLHYLWPLFIILFAPLLLKNVRMEGRHIAAGLIGFAGAVACLNPGSSLHLSAIFGLLIALLSAGIWAYYSVWSRQYADVPTAAVSLYCMLAGLASLATYAVLGAFPSLDVLNLGGSFDAPDSSQWWVLLYLAAGPLGGAFYLWDYAMKKGNPQQIALLAYAVPIASTAFVSLYLGRGLDKATAVGAVLVTFAVAVGSRTQRSRSFPQQSLNTGAIDA